MFKRLVSYFFLALLAACAFKGYQSIDQMGENKQPNSRVFRLTFDPDVEIELNADETSTINDGEPLPVNLTGDELVFDVYADSIAAQTDSTMNEADLAAN